jgi:hypothetical protein
MRKSAERIFSFLFGDNSENKVTPRAVVRLPHSAHASQPYAVLTETCHYMHDRSSRSGGRDGQKQVIEGREDSANVG